MLCLFFDACRFTFIVGFCLLLLGFDGFIIKKSVVRNLNVKGVLPSCTIFGERTLPRELKLLLLNNDEAAIGWRIFDGVTNTPLGGRFVLSCELFEVGVDFAIGMGDAGRIVEFLGEVDMVETFPELVFENEMNVRSALDGDVAGDVCAESVTVALPSSVILSRAVV